MVLLFKSIIALSLTTLVLSDNLSWEEENFVHAISGIKSVRSNTKRESKVVDYDKAIHGPKKAYRMAGPPAESFGHVGHTFDLKMYQNELNLLISKEKASEARLLESEVHYKKRSLDVDFIELQKRTASGYGAYQFDTDISYPTEIVYTLDIGTPAQKVPIVFDLTTTGTMIPGASLVNGAVTVDTKLKARTNSHLVQSLFTPKLSTTCYTYPTGQIDQVIWAQSAWDPTSFQDVGVKSCVVSDYVSFPSAKFKAKFNVLVTRRIPAIAIIVGYMYYHGIIGLAPPGALPPLEEDPMVAPLEIALVYSDYVNRRVANFANVLSIAPVGDQFAVDDLAGDLPQRRRGMTGTGTGTPAYSSELLFGGSDPNKYVQPLIPFPVVGTPGISQKLIWQLAFGVISVAQAGMPPMTTSIMGIAQFDIAHRLTYLTASFVKTLYAGFFNSKPPTASNPFYTYFCRTPPTISFNAVDSTGLNRVLTLNALDWNVKQSLDSPGWCVGAIQPLPVGATRQIIGLQFLKTFYGAFKLDIVGQGSTISFATSKRI